VSQPPHNSTSRALNPSDEGRLRTNEAIAWFREASPYINEHRGKTVVLCVPDRLLSSTLLATLTHDLTLLSRLGVRLLVCFGVRSDVDARLDAKSEFHNGRRVTNDVALQTVIEAAGAARSDLEARLSMGLPNTPMAGYGVHDGVDFLHTGTVREIQSDVIRSLLSAGNLVLLPPVGHSLTGEVFNLPTEEVAVETAVAMEADKLIMFAPSVLTNSDQQWVREANPNTLCALATSQSNDAVARTYRRAADASERGVQRVHLLPDNDPDALLRELFTVDGAGTLITSERFENLRDASISDVGGIIELIEPLQRDGTLVQRSKEQLELDINQFIVLERDGKVVACAALFTSIDNSNAEIANRLWLEFNSSNSILLGGVNGNNSNKR